MRIAEMAGRMVDLREVLASHLADIRPELIGLCQQIWCDPELSHEEHRAAARLASTLEEAGFVVDRGVGGLPTAFSAEAGTGSLLVVLCAEYDALPELGHGCGHHLIAGAAVGAAIALRPVADELDLRIRVLGTPAEEHGGGKEDLLRAGLFDDVDFALMAHMIGSGTSVNPEGSTSQFVGRFRATFSGRAAHAANAPQLGVNAGDAAVIAQVAIGLLRQQIPTDHRVSAITRDGGNVTNIIPDRSIVDFECRAWTRSEFDVLLKRVMNCFRAASQATGADVEIALTEHMFEPLLQNDVLCRRWASAMSQLGFDTAPADNMTGGSTDMGNVSQFLPAIHPWVPLRGASAALHSREFATAANTDESYGLMVDVALGLALTVAAVAGNVAERALFTKLRLARPPYADTESRGRGIAVAEVANLPTNMA